MEQQQPDPLAPVEAEPAPRERHVPDEVWDDPVRSDRRALAREVNGQVRAEWLRDE